MRSAWMGLGAALCWLATGQPATAGSSASPPSPYLLLGNAAADTPMLDAVPICLPAIGGGLAPVVELARRGELAAASALLRASAPEGDGSPAVLPASAAPASPAPGSAGPAHPPEPAIPPTPLNPERELLRALLSARLVEDADAWRLARARLRTALDTPLASDQRACARLEAARLELLGRRLPEARAELARAGREEAGPASSANYAEALRFLRAEVLHASGHPDAEEIHAGLVEASEPRIARAAGLRRAEARCQADPSAAHFRAFEDRVLHRDISGADPGRWGPRAAELALAAGDAEAAGRWLEVAEPGFAGVSAEALSIRRADVALRRGARAAAAKALRLLTSRQPGSAAAAVAQIRLAEHGLGSTGDDEWLRRLERIAQRPERRIARYAQGVLARQQVATRQIDAAIASFARLAYQGADAAVLPSFAEDLDAALAAATAEVEAEGGSGCAGLLVRLAGRRSLLLRKASRPEPFLQLGDCYLELGLARTALEVFQSTQRRFGASVSEALTLRAARAALGSGELALARASAEAVLARAAEGHKVAELGAWTLLQVEIDFLEQQYESVVALLEPALREGRVGPRRQPEAVLLLARAARHTAASPRVRRTLRQVLAAPPTGESDEAGDRSRLLGEAALHTADLERAAGRDPVARALYATAAAGLEPGALRARAEYWAGALAQRDVELGAARAAWRRGAAVEPEGAWSRLSEASLEVSAIRQAVGPALEVAP